MTYWRDRRNRQIMLAHQLEAALEHHDVDEAAYWCGKVETARMLTARPLLSETQRGDLRARMLRIAELADKTGDADAGTRETTGGGIGIHTAIVTLPDGFVKLADMDELPAARAAKVVRSVLGEEVKGARE